MLELNDGYDYGFFSYIFAMSDFTKLKFYLMTRGISQSRISQDTGLHKNTICKLLRSGNGSKSVKELMRLYLGLESDEFYNLLMPKD